MQEHPEIPHLADAPAVAESGHLWVTELIDGDPVRFRLSGDGRVEFGDRRRVFGGDDPPEYRYLTRHVRAHLDRRALSGALGDPATVTFFGVATRRRSIDYDWERLPAFLGTDVWDDREGAFRPPDAAHGIFERLGLTPVNAVARELAARDFDPGTFAVPDSAWYDGPAKGVVVHNKAGGRAKRRHPSFVDGDARSVDPVPGTYDDPADLAAAYATDDRIRRALASTDATDAVDRVFDLVVREAYPHVFGRRGVEFSGLRAAVAERVYERVGNG